MSSTSVASGQHPAAILFSKDTHLLEVANRSTPTPGPRELLIEVKSIAINPIDFYQRGWGFAIASYPSVVGSDIGGIVVSAGSSVGSDAPQPGTRVAAFAPCFNTKGNPDYGAYQKYALVPSANATPLTSGVSFNEASVLPMAVVTAMAGWHSIGLPRDTAYTPAEKQGMLVWGAASSVGTAAVQSAKSMGYTVYATASEKHHEYIKKLGASKVFDYKYADVVSHIVHEAKVDGVSLSTGYDAVGQLQSCLDVLKQFKGEEGKARLASAPQIPKNAPTEEGVEVKFVASPAEEEPRTEFFGFVMNTWLKEKLATGEFVPSPAVQVVDGGLEGLNKALDEWKKGVSGKKIVVEV